MVEACRALKRSGNIKLEKGELLHGGGVGSCGVRGYGSNAMPVQGRGQVCMHTAL